MIAHNVNTPPCTTLTIGIVALATLIAALPVGARAEYGDVVMNQRSDAAGAAPVVFPHWFHRVRFRCKVCHGDLGFAPKAGGNDVSMLSIIDGQHCGACHDGDIAWSSERCEVCHSGKRGLPTQVHKGTPVKLGPLGGGK